METPPNLTSWSNISLQLEILGTTDYGFKFRKYNTSGISTQIAQPNKLQTLIYIARLAATAWDFILRINTPRVSFVTQIEMTEMTEEV